MSDVQVARYGPFVDDPSSGDLERFFRMDSATSVYIDAAVKALEASGTTISDEINARISPLEFGHITFHGRYTFRRPELAGALRPLRDPNATSE